MGDSHAIQLDDVSRLKREAKRAIALFAGASAAQAALEHRLVDEIRLIQYPVLLGGGTSLFATDDGRRDLELIESRSFGSGATLQRYRFNAS